ncbi:MAG: glutamate:Na+ symporter, family [Phycisphaerales bacterium]|jgi:ESS family glutamate:Na+ symporter|nr:glutamate:Na+ symporter, family [Phycisphaerales bacterium]
MTISAWWLLAAAVPVLLLGEFLVRRMRWLARFDVPVPIVGGFIVALVVLALNASGVFPIVIETKTAVRGWTWLIHAEPQWRAAPVVPLYLPFSTAFFTCVGLSASWAVARRGSWQLLVFLLLATILAVLQNTLGVALSRLMDVSPYLGLLCGSVTLTGGPSTALGFADVFEKAGFPAAATVGAAAAMFGIVTGSFLGGAVGGTLVRRRALRDAATEASTVVKADTPRHAIFDHLAALARQPLSLLIHLVILLACIKVGAWVTLWLRNAGVTLPVYIGAMLTAIVVRNVLDAAGATLIRNGVIDRIAAVVLAIFLAIAMSSLNLLELRTLAAPMIVILAAQVILTVLFAFFVTFLIMGCDYDAAVMSAGHVGFGLGITANAVATMDVLTAKFGPSPRAMLIVTIVGAFLIDLTNALTITVYLNLLK